MIKAPTYQENLSEFYLLYTEKILNEKLHFLCSGKSNCRNLSKKLVMFFV